MIWMLISVNLLSCDFSTDWYLGAESEEDCAPCTGGYYCETEGLDAPTGLCDAGYYCPSNDTISASDPNGYLCPAGG